VDEPALEQIGFWSYESVGVVKHFAGAVRDASTTGIFCASAPSISAIARGTWSQLVANLAATFIAARALRVVDEF
jgi:hypothetical protein